MNAHAMASGSVAAAIGWFYLVTNSARVFTYIPQIVAVWRCRDGARAISLFTWSSWVISHAAAIAYGLLVIHDAFFVAISTINLICSAMVTGIAACRRRAFLETARGGDAGASAIEPARPVPALPASVRPPQARRTSAMPRRPHLRGPATSRANQLHRIKPAARATLRAGERHPVPIRSPQQCASWRSGWPGEPSAAVASLRLFKAESAMPGSTTPSVDVQGDLDRLTASFFGAVSFEAGEMPAYENIHALFIESGLLIKNTGAFPEVSSVRQFIEPRRAMVRSGELTRLREMELAQTTQIFGNVAQRFTAYAKSGTLQGIPFEAWGMISTQFVLTPAGWKMSAMAWDDERPSLTLPASFDPASDSVMMQSSTRSNPDKGLTQTLARKPGGEFGGASAESNPDAHQTSAPSTNIVRRSEPSRTALRVAELRAVHQLLDEPLVLPDPVALPLLGACAEAVLRADPSALDDPLSRGVRAAVVARSRFVEDRLARCVAAGVKQYVVLGAGLDTFAYRNPFPEQGLRVLEVDHPGTQRWKRQRLCDAGIDVPPSVGFVPMDFEHDELDGALRLAGFRTDQATCVSWMGVTMYLTNDAVLRTLRAVAAFAPGTCLCFDYRVPTTMLDAIERLAYEVVGAQAAELGEPWLSAFDPVHLRGQLLALGFGSAQTAVADELNERYFARRSDGLRTGSGFRIMCAIK